MNTKILGFAGRKRAGKTSAANFIVGTFLTNIMQDNTNESIISYFKLDDRGRLIVPSNLEPKLIYNTQTLAWEPSDTQSEAIFDVKGTKTISQSNSWLSEVLWPYVKVYSFADILKDIIHNLLEVDYDFLNGDKKECETHLVSNKLPSFKGGMVFDSNRNLLGREAAQYLGTDIFRAMHPNCFVNYVLRQIAIEKPMYALVDDCRFENEVRGILDNGGIVYSLERTADKDVTADHASEKLDATFQLCTRRINNNDMSVNEKNEAIMGLLTQDKFFDQENSNTYN